MSLPHAITDLQRVIGRTAAIRLRLVARDGRIYIPTRPIQPDHPLARAIGQQAATRLQRHYGGEMVSYPRRGVESYLRDVRTCRRWTQGNSPEDLAQSHGVCIRTIYRAINRIKTNDLHPCPTPPIGSFPHRPPAGNKDIVLIG